MVGYIISKHQIFQGLYLPHFFSFFLEIDCENFNFFFNIKGYHSNTAPS